MGKTILEAQTKIRLADIDSLTIYDEDDHRLFNLDALLASVYTLISGLTDQLSNQYFSHAVLQHSLKRYPEENELKADDI